MRAGALTRLAGLTVAALAAVSAPLSPALAAGGPGPTGATFTIADCALAGRAFHVPDLPLDPAEAARICAQVAHALSYAHGQGVVHRDIKAQNVLLTSEGGVKLADFGIARLIESDGEAGLTKTDMLLGSADYLSPEQ
ncbi:MAG: protein kinase domain-containing protein, partial [Solirubrobacterales bacterium]